MTKLVLVRHAAVEIDTAISPLLWQLSDAGRAGARHLARDRIWRPIERIFSSPEVKAFETAHILAGPNGMTVTAIEELHEVIRPPGQWFGDDYPGGYSGAVRDYFAQPAEAVHGWEPALEAQQRILTCLAYLRRWESGDFAIAGHGLTLSLYVAAVTELDPGDIWPAIQLPDYAVLEPDRGCVIRPFGFTGNADTERADR